MLRTISDLTFRHDVSIDVVTYCGPAGFARALERLFDDENVPVRIVTSTTPERMARRTSYEHDIYAIFDANAEHRMVYGRKGVYLTDYRQLGGMKGKEVCPTRATCSSRSGTCKTRLRVAIQVATDRPASF